MIAIPLRKLALIVTIAIFMLLQIGCSAPINRQLAVYTPNDPDAYNYLLYLPQGYRAEANADKKWPTLIFLHGIMEKGDNLGDVASVALPAVLEDGREIPFIVISPQIASWTDFEPPRVMASLDHALSANYRIDPNRIIVTGHSLGGAAAYDAAIAYPDRIAAIAPLAGWGPSEKAEAMKNVSVWAFHGAADPMIPIVLHRPMIQALREAGADVKFTVYANAHHIAKDTYRKQSFHDWALQQKLND